jgi:hypothetical protein
MDVSIEESFQFMAEHWVETIMAGFILLVLTYFVVTTAVQLVRGLMVFGLVALLVFLGARSSSRK